MQLVQMKALECSNKPLLFLSLSTDPICWHRNCSHIHARECKIQLRKSLSSFRACLNCRAGSVLQSYMSGAVNTSATWTCLQVHGQQWASCWSAVKRPTKGKFVTRRACTYLIISATSLTLLPRYATGRTVNFPTDRALFLSCSLVNIVFPILYGVLCKRWWKRKSHSQENIPCTNLCS